MSKGEQLQQPKEQIERETIPNEQAKIYERSFRQLMVRSGNNPELIEAANNFIHELEEKAYNGDANRRLDDDKVKEVIDFLGARTKN